MTLEFTMPKLGESVTEGTIGRWLKQPGETIEQYEPMLEVNTDKVDTEVSSPISGTLVEILVGEGETVPIGTVIARLARAGETTSPGSNGSSASSSQMDTSTPEPHVSHPSAPISPAVARLAAEHNIELSQIKGTGRGGRVTKKDVEAFVAAQSNVPTQEQTQVRSVPDAQIDRSAAPQAITLDAALQQTAEAGPRTEEEEQASQAMPPVLPVATARASRRQSSVLAMEPGDELVPLTAMRRAIAEHMVRSKQTAPHVTTVFEVDLSRIVAHREHNKQDFERQGVKLTFTPYFVEACARALQEVPIVNASYTSEGVVMHNRIHIGIAVALQDGLIVPVIKDADGKSLLGLARTINDLADRARNRLVQPDDVQGGTFTITNHGVSGSLFAMPIINQPQSAILGIGAIQKRVVVVSEHGFDAMAIRPMCYLSLTFDHRLIDGATADAFVSVVKQTLETYEK